MANIGDLYYTFRGDGARLEADAKKAGAAAGDTASKSFAGRMKAGIGKTFSGAKGGLLGGLGLGVGLGAIGVATTAVAKLTDVMGDAVQAAIEEEASISKLDAALQANVEGYDGNTDAIEKTLAARMRLGFADDEQRQSLANLVSVTKDSTKALGLQRAAMDLARLRGIDLATASDIIGKVYAGNLGTLSRYGIVLKKGATATEALAEIQKRAAGQAEAWAETNEGKLLVSQIKVGEALEKLGGRALPFVAAGVEGAAEAIETLVLGLDALGKTLDVITTGKMPETRQEAVDMTDALLGLASILPGVGGQMARLGQDSLDPLKASLAETARETRRGSGVMEAALGDTEVAFDDLADEAGQTATRVDAATGKMITSVEDLRDATISAARDIVTQAYEIIEDKAALAAINVEKAELRKVIATGNATKEQKQRYRELTQAQAELTLDLAENGQENAKVVKVAVADLREQLKTATGQERRAIQATITALERLETQYKNTARASRRVNWPSGTGGTVGGKVVGDPRRASGGQVAQGSRYVWSEPRTPELFLPAVSGRIAAMPEIRAAVAAGGGGGAGDQNTVNIYAPTVPTSVLEAAEQLARVRRLRS